MIHEHIKEKKEYFKMKKGENRARSTYKGKKTAKILSRKKNCSKE